MSDDPNKKKKKKSKKRKIKGDRPPPPRRKYVFFGKRLQDQELGTRSIFVNQPQPRLSAREFTDNSISTTKYTLLTFLPKNLFEQFRRLANFWFLLVAILHLIPAVAPVNPITSIAPLIFVLSVTAIKEFYEDQARRVADRKTNTRSAEVLSGGQHKTVPWQDVKVGDIIRVKTGETVPADIIVLSSSEPNGVCYIETAAIDGETNLKARQALIETSEIQDFGQFAGNIECEKPNNRLYAFNGNIESSGKFEKKSLSLKQLLYRGCVLRNTQWIYGAVVYTGHQTKLMKNATRTPSKSSLLEKEINQAVATILIFCILLCVLCGIGHGIFVAVWGFDHRYLNLNDDFFGPVIIIAIRETLTFIILYSVMVPISLYVSMELVKLGLVYWIDQDLEMYDPESDTPAKARTSNLSEQLGQIEYIFSDKTGTLTANQMEFQRCTIGGVAYGKAPTPGETSNKANDKYKGQGAGYNFDDPKLLQDLQGGNERVREFLTLLAVCHTVLIDQSSDNKTYQASSPDEAALVLAAKELGFEFVRRNQTSVFITVNGREEEYKVLNVLEFSSDRKRMSVIVRCPDGKIRLYTKGADSVVYKRLKSGDDALHKATADHLQEFSSEGLRTLACAAAEISEEDYQRWNKKHSDAVLDATAARDAKLDTCAEEIEQNLTLLGATAIEDKLQDGVPDTIETLARANLKLWVLTGDKEETAVNIGYSCRLLNDKMHRMHMNGANCADKQAATSLFDRYIGEARSKKRDELAFVVDGAVMDLVFGDTALEDKMFELASQCRSVICCRCSPLQKALVVKLVKDRDNAQCLAIGDGANDVPMIQSAQVGVGISGKEGLQAVNSSDYAIAQFRFLEPLLLIHGRWDYRRIAKLFLYSFYKNMMNTLVQFWFVWFCGFSGQIITDGWPGALFNAWFTFLPVLILAVVDQDMSKEKVRQYPQVYETSQKGREFSKKKLWLWLFMGFYQSIVIFFLTFFLYEGVMSSDGTTYGLWATGHTAYGIVIIVANLTLMFEFFYWTVWGWIVMIGSVLLWFFFMSWYSLIVVTEPNDMLGLTENLWRTPTYWLITFLVPVVALWPYVTYKVLARNYRPENFHIIQEQMYLENKGKRDKYSGSAKQ